MFHYNSNGSPNKDDVEPDVPVSHVPGIHLNSFVIGRIAAAAGLPHAGDAGADHIKVFNKGAVFLDFIAYDGARSDEAHVPCQDVEQLRQFVKAGLRKKAPLLVTRGSFFSLNSVSHSFRASGSRSRSSFSLTSASTHMLRNL